VKPRVNELLKEAASTPLEQTARPSIEGELGLVVTELPSVAATPMSTLESLVTPPPPSVRSARALEATSAAAAVDARFDPALSVRDRISFSALRAAPAEAQRRFGHEYASEIWRRGGARLCSMRDGSEVPFGADVCGVERDDASSIVRVDLCLAPSPHGLLVVFEGGGDVQRERLAVALPTDPEGPVPVRLTLSIARSAPDQRPRIQTLQARLGTPSDGNPHYQYLWSLTRQADLGSLADAVGRADAQRLVDAARDKVRSTTAAMAGVLLLARGGALARIGDWARNLMNWFPDVPDGAVLWAESLRAALVRGESAPFGVAHPLEEMNQALETLRVRGLPFFADSLELTHSLTRYLRRAERSSANPSAARLARLDALDAQLSRAFRIATPSGHFLMLAGLPRPEGFDGGTGALSVDEMLRTLRPSSTP
ncbi:MAG: hypothetical protein K8H88_01590, partial [Sandaracinaceae bacterium]|nr:hypothetical protein [Sandaracinaceae bacterium]